MSSAYLLTSWDVLLGPQMDSLDLILDVAPVEQIHPVGAQTQAVGSESHVLGRDGTILNIMHFISKFSSRPVRR